MDETEGNKLLDMKAEDVLEFIYELSDKWKTTKDPIESMQGDLRTMIRYFKEEKFDKLQEEFGISS